MHRHLTATLAALRRNRAARDRHQAARARHDMRTWQVERRHRTRRLIELGGLVVKAGIIELTGDDRATILGALLWMADKLQSDQGERARAMGRKREASVRGGPGDTQIGQMQRRKSKRDSPRSSTKTVAASWVMLCLC
jgi:hypothetical protein